MTDRKFPRGDFLLYLSRRQSRETVEMVIYRCDGCGAQMQKNDLRYVVNIDVRAAYDTLEIRLIDLVRSHREQILRLIERLRHEDVEHLEEQVYKKITLDLCPQCQQAYIHAPLGFTRGPREAASPVDVDAFLRSLVFGKTPESEESQDSVVYSGLGFRV